MPKLVQLTYSSVARHPFKREDLLGLLEQSRRSNKLSSITGMLLYSDGSFFQVLEGEADAIEKLFNTISHDSRHEQVTVIIKETVATRSFADWTMGYAEITAQDVDQIIGINDFFTSGRSWADLRHDRVKMLLQAFKEGRWREKLSDQAPHRPSVIHDKSMAHQSSSALHHLSFKSTTRNRAYTFAFQPIIDVSTKAIFSYEALLRGPKKEPAQHILSQIPDTAIHKFDEQSRLDAVKLAVDLGLKTHLNLNLLPRSIENSATAISSLLETIEALTIQPDQVIIEILEREIIRDFTRFNELLNEYRNAGITLAIDDFGSGYAGLNMLADFQPNFVKLDINLVKGISEKGPRQAIVRGIHHTCRDLGIDIIAEGVETVAEYRWLDNEGITLFQGNLFAEPAFEALSTEFTLP